MIINDTLFNCELNEVLDEIDSQRSMYGLSPFTKRRDSGKDIMVQCPYHNERRPSAGIRKSDGQFHCFACQESHSLPELISYCFEKYDDTLGKFGWQWLLKNFATMQVEERRPIELNISRGQKKAEEQTYISEEELDTYRYIHPYMYERLYNACKENNTEIAISNVLIREQNNKKIWNYKINKSVVYTFDEMMQKKETNDNIYFVGVWNKIVKTDTAKKVRFMTDYIGRSFVYEDIAYT